MMMTTQQSETNLNIRQRIIRRKTTRKQNFSRQHVESKEVEPKEDASTFTAKLKGIIAGLKWLKEALATLTWLKAVLASLFGLGLVYCSSAAVKPLATLFPQANAGQQFLWAHPDNAVKAGFDSECAKPTLIKTLINTFGLGGISSGLRLQYGLVPAMSDGGWGVHWDHAPTKQFDASGFNHVSFWVRGASGEESFEIGLKDKNAVETKIESKDWIAISDLKHGIEVVIPLAEFKGVNKKSLNNISFSFNAQRSSGSICIDSIAFGGKGGST